jgi:signal transduction histidine kinase/AraC-like DNA-binding protein
MMMTNKTGTESFTEDDQKMLTVVASLAGQLLVNRQLQDEAVRRREELTRAQLESEKLKEVNDTKSRFFSNVSHDVRTPLSLILAPLEELEESASSQEERDRIGIVRRNARHLLRLINQLLDVSRAEAGSLQLHITRGDVAQCVRAVVSSCEPLAQKKRIDLRYDAPESLEAGFDQDKMEKIIYNLLSNALKFTPSGGSVHLTLAPHQEGDGWVEICVEDTGRGIPEEELSKVFLRFYQARGSIESSGEGSGIGLALVKEFVELHGGSVSVTSAVGKGSRFLVSLPADLKGLPEGVYESVFLPTTGVDESAEPTHDRSGSQEKQSPLPLVLIVEDHAEMRSYIRDNLKGSYRVIEAQDGEQGVELALEAGPDLVISDVMMPGLSGTDLCLRLKEDLRTSHIPIILLTAKAEPEERLHGLESGADDYLTKPFSWQELKTRVANLLELRQRLREKFKKMVLVRPGELDIPSADEAFLLRVYEIIEARLGDETFDVDELARGVSLSYSQLQRKIRALTGLPPTHYIRSIRLQRGREMLSKNAGTVSEIAYSVGFGSPAYFTRCFHAQYGIPPSQLRRS